MTHSIDEIEKPLRLALQLNINFNRICIWIDIITMPILIQHQNGNFDPVQHQHYDDPQKQHL
jgi:hypothetical protein